MADPGCPRRGGTNHKDGGANLLFWTIFPINCMKNLKIGSRGDTHLWRLPLDRCQWYSILINLTGQQKPNSINNSENERSITNSSLISSTLQLLLWYKILNMFGNFNKRFKFITRSPEALCRAVVFVLYFICLNEFCYIFIKVQLLWLLHSIGPSP